MDSDDSHHDHDDHHRQTITTEPQQLYTSMRLSVLLVDCAAALMAFGKRLLL